MTERTMNEVDAEQQRKERIAAKKLERQRLDEEIAELEDAAFKASIGNAS